EPAVLPVGPRARAPGDGARRGDVLVDRAVRPLHQGERRAPRGQHPARGGGGAATRGARRERTAPPPDRLPRLRLVRHGAGARRRQGHHEAGQPPHPRRGRARQREGRDGGGRRARDRRQDRPHEPGLQPRDAAPEHQLPRPRQDRPPRARRRRALGRPRLRPPPDGVRRQDGARRARPAHRHERLQRDLPAGDPGRQGGLGLRRARAQRPRDLPHAGLEREHGGLRLRPHGSDLARAPGPRGDLAPAVMRLALLLLLLLAAPARAQSTPEALRAALDAILDDPAFDDAHWGVHVLNLETGETLYGRNQQKNFVPASVQKLLTTAAALDALGPDFRYSTSLWADGAVRDGTLQGHLVVRGSGDPTIGDRLFQTHYPRDGDPLAIFRAWADSLRATGITAVSDHVIG